MLACVALCACTPTLSQPRGDTHLSAMAEATRDYHHGRFAESARAYHAAAAAAERRVDRDEARYREAKALARTGELAQALVLFDAVAAVQPVSRRTARALYDGARLRLRTGDAAGALHGFQRVVLEFPDHGVSARALRRVVEALGADADVRAWLESTYSQVGTHDIGDDILVLEAEMELRHENRAAARALLERTIAEHPYPMGQRWDDALWRLADLDEEEHAPAAAAAHLEQMLSVFETTTTPGSYTLPRFPAAMLRLGILYRDGLHDPERATATFHRLYNEMRFSTLRDDAILEEGRTALSEGNPPRACELFHRVVDEFEVGSARRHATELLTSSCPR